MKFVREKKDLSRIALVIGLGLILIFIGTKNKNTATETDIGMEARLAEACSGVDGVGECEVLVYYSPGDQRDDEGNIESVIVICEGADSADVRLRLTEMLSAFYGIGANRIRVEKMKG